MEQVLPFVTAGGIIALVGGIIALASHFEKVRREAFVAWGAQHGLVVWQDTAAAMRELEAFRLFGRGHSRRVKNVLCGQREAGRVLVCDFQYTTGGGKHRTTHTQTVCVLSTPGRTGESFFVRRQAPLFDTIGKLFGGQDINFDDDPVFSKAWVLQGPDEDRVRRLFGSRLRDWFNDNRDKSVFAEAQGAALLLHFGRTLKAVELGDLLAMTTNLRRHWA